MKLITKAQMEQLRANGRETLEAMNTSGHKGEPVHRPVVKLFNPAGAATWLLSEVDPDDDDHAFGLCDLGFGCPELGWVSLAEIASVRGRFGLPMERDRHFKADKTLVEYWEAAREAGRIVA